MAANKRLYFAVYAAGFAQVGSNSFTEVHGLQSIGVTTRFNLEQVFEIGQISIYQNVENVPDVEVTMEKVLDGNPLLYHLGTTGSSSATLTGRSNVKSTIGISYYSDVQDSASGTPLQQTVISGVFPSSLTYSSQIQGPTTESVTFVGNNQSWLTSAFTFQPSFTNTDAPISGSGVVFHQHINFGNNSDGTSSRIPTDIPGISSSGYNEKVADEFGSHIQSVRVSTNLGRDQLLELGRRGPYHRYVNFPIEVRTDFEVYCQKGHGVTALEAATSNIVDQRIYLQWTDGTKINLGTANKLQSVTETGGNASQNGGNRTLTFSYVNYNDMTVTHPRDTTLSLRA